jgi:hypothetical protein
MSAHYDGPDKRLHYLCEQRQVDYGGSLCQGLAGRGLDALVAQQVLEVLEPATLELSLAAAVDIEAERERLHRHWQQQLERAGYEAERAARQYHAVEPENRLVARELERRWEAALQVQRQVQEDYRRFQCEQPRGLSLQDRDAIRALAAHIPDLWEAETTTAADRTAIARHLIDRVVVAVRDDSEYVDVTIHWLGGMTSAHELIRPVGRYEQMRDYKELLEYILELHEQGWSARQIAEQLNREGWRPPRRRATFNAPMIRKLLSRNVRRGREVDPTEASILLESDEWWFGALARQLDMPPATLYSWLRRGWVHARQLPGVCGRWILWAGEDELSRLRHLRGRQRSWSEDPPPRDLTTPKPRPGKEREYKRDNEGR